MPVIEPAFGFNIIITSFISPALSIMPDTVAGAGLNTLLAVTVNLPG